jgi:hypothetical protein
MYKILPVFFVTSDIIKQNPLTVNGKDNGKLLPLSSLEQHIVNTVRSMDLREACSKNIINSKADSITRVILYLIHMFKPRTTLILTSMCNVELNIKNYLRYNNEIANEDRYDLVISDFTDDKLPEFIHYKCTWKFYISNNYNLKYDAFSKNIIDLNPKLSLRSYLPLTDKEFIDEYIRHKQEQDNQNIKHIILTNNDYSSSYSSSDILSISSSSSENNSDNYEGEYIEPQQTVVCMMKTSYGVGYAAINLLIDLREDVFVVFDYENIYKLEYKHLPLIYYELEELDEPLEWTMNEILNLSDRHCREFGNKFAKKIDIIDLISMCLSKDDRPNTFILISQAKLIHDLDIKEVDELLISYFNNMRLMAIAEPETKIYINEAK